MFKPSKSLRIGRFALLVLVTPFAFVLGSWLFTINRLNAARSIGVFPSPSEGMLALVQSGWVGIQEARVVHAEQETAPGGGPHIWYVIACVWAESRVDGSPVGSATHDYDAPGSYFVDTHEGWVLMPEASLPLFVGFWMKIFGLAGNDIVEPFHDLSTGPSRMCVRQPTFTSVTAVPPTSTLITTPVPNVTVEPASSTKKMLLLYDDDGSLDGTVALLYLLSQPDISVQAINISYGEAHPELYVQHIGRVLDTFGMSDIPLGAGQDMPLAGGTPFPNWLRQLSDNFWDYPLPNAGKTYLSQDAPELIVSVIDQASEPVTIFLSGPFTNLAQALRLDSGIKENITAVYFMGGAVYVPGNIINLLPESNNRVAEWNILADPQAAKEVFESGLELYMVPLDATHKVILHQEDILPWRQGDEKANMVADLYDNMFKNYGFNTSEIFDLTAAVIMVQPEACVFQPLHLDVITEDGNTLGQTIVVPNTEPNIHACLDPNADQVRQNLDETFSK